jgi:hypothetical protein
VIWGRRGEGVGDFELGLSKNVKASPNLNKNINKIRPFENLYVNLLENGEALSILLCHIFFLSLLSLFSVCPARIFKLPCTAVTDCPAKCFHRYKRHIGWYILE